MSSLATIATDAFVTLFFLITGPSIIRSLKRQGATISGVRRYWKLHRIERAQRISASFDEHVFEAIQIQTLWTKAIWSLILGGTTMLLIGFGFIIPRSSITSVFGVIEAVAIWAFALGNVGLALARSASADTRSVDLHLARSRLFDRERTIAEVRALRAEADSVIKTSRKPPTPEEGGA